MNDLENILTNAYKTKEREERIIDKNGCDYYLTEIKNGNYTIIESSSENC